MQTCKPYNIAIISVYYLFQHCPEFNYSDIILGLEKNKDILTFIKTSGFFSWFITDKLLNGPNFHLCYEHGRKHSSKHFDTTFTILSEFFMILLR